MNCLLTSWIISFAAFPTASIVKAENKNGNIPPINIPATTWGFVTSIEVNFTAWVYDANNANAVKAAEPIANPLPIAAVVLPTASSLSVIFLTSWGNSHISAIPPALSAIGPYASTAIVIPQVESIPIAATEIPYNPWPAFEKPFDAIYDTKIPIAITTIGPAVDFIPTAKPEIIFVDEPVSDSSAIFWTGFLSPEV